MKHKKNNKNKKRSFRKHFFLKKSWIFLLSQPWLNSWQNANPPFRMFFKKSYNTMFHQNLLFSFFLPKYTCPDENVTVHNK